MAKEKSPLLRGFLRKIGFLVFGFILALLFALTVIMGQPQNEMETAQTDDQILQPASPAVSFNAETPGRALLDTFPVAGLVCTTDDLSLVEGTCFDTAFEDGFARVLKLIYENAEGARFVVTSIYPRRATGLLSDEVLKLRGKGLEIAGYPSAEMVGNGRIRMHIQTDYGLYSVESGEEDRDQMTDVLKKLQLIE